LDILLTLHGHVWKKPIILRKEADVPVTWRNVYSGEVICER
jgi:hypothetical protein